MRAEYQKLRDVLEAVAWSKSCIAQNRGYEKEQARESYDHVVADELGPAITVALESLLGDLDAADVQRFGEYVSKLIEKKVE